MADINHNLSSCVGCNNTLKKKHAKNWYIYFPYMYNCRLDIINKKKERKNHETYQDLFKKRKTSNTNILMSNV